MNPQNEKLQFFLNTIREKIEKLNGRRAVTLEKYKGNYDLQKIVERELHEAIQAAIDCSARIIALNNFRHSDDYVGMFDSLLENKVIPSDLAPKIKDLVRFRNILIHEYFRIDQEKVYKHLHEDPEILHQFLRYIVDFLQ